MDVPHDPDFFNALYTELRDMARQALERERPGQTLQPTALVHEVYLRMCRGAHASTVAGRRDYFFAAAAQAMRRVLVEAARRKATAKRGGAWDRSELTPEEVAAPERAGELLALEEALDKLAAHDPPVAELVQLRYFGGLTLRECADALGVSPRTADGYWAYARAWLSRELRNSRD